MFCVPARFLFEADWIYFVFFIYKKEKKIKKITKNLPEK